MKKLTLTTASFRYLEQSYGEWLDILGYAPTTVKVFPVMIRELLHHLEKKGCTQIKQIDIPQIKTYYKTLAHRSNQRQGGGLSNNYLNVHLNAIDLLLEYLRQQARIIIPPTGIPKETPNPSAVEPLTLQQVQQLYTAVDTYEAMRDQHFSRCDSSALALRDKAVLAVFYDCGLRRSEGENLNLSDIHYENRLLEVRKGKGGQPRLVPMSKNTITHLENYQYEGRPVLVRRSGEDAFLIGQKGQRATGNMLNGRLKEIQKYSDDAALRQKNLHLHILRHSIATHLLYQGISLEKVAQFLGHRSLESTTIYTHLMEKHYG